MSALAWLFGLGFAAIAFPVLLHLIRQTPRGEVAFSSLMFLRPSPPRVTRRSRIDHWLLLVLRALAIGLIVFAFMRPFFPDRSSTIAANAGGRKVAYLVDTSASMRREGLWEQARARLRDRQNRADPGDRSALFTFDQRVTTVVSFDETAQSAQSPLALQLADVQPGWQRADLGVALIQVADEMHQAKLQDGDPATLQIVVISDMQTGTDISALQNYRWPEDVRVDFEMVGPLNPGNAAIRLLEGESADSEALLGMAMVRNAKDSQIDQFSVMWADDPQSAIRCDVPPGESRVVRLPVRTEPEMSGELVLAGDPAEFDNRFFVVPPNQQRVSIAWLGNEAADDPDEMRYYFDRCLQPTPTRTVTIESFPAEQPFLGAAVPDLMVVTRPISTEERREIDRCLAASSSLWVVLHDPTIVESTRRWTGAASVEPSTSPAADGYAMLGQIEFGHPLFQPLSGPRFNDFTKIRFWQHLRVGLSDDAELIARFDNGDPALWQQNQLPLAGRVFVLSTGWQPSHSQWALSSKFLPVIDRMIDLTARSPKIPELAIIGRSTTGPTPVGFASLRRGDQVWPVDPDIPLTRQIPEPGVYTLVSSDHSEGDTIRLAINLDPAESQTEIMPVEQISALGVNVGRQLDAQAIADRQRTLRDVELESRQKIWKWLIVAGVLVLGIESWLAGRIDHKRLIVQTPLERTGATA